ncbi:MAG: hypothetical protein J7494_12340 [Sphingobium sp.]|nr:hypothetical protein [Sphingobium sp.]
MDGQGISQVDDALMLDEAMEAPPIVRFDERRMHIRAYNYWSSLLGDRNLPSIEDLNPAEIEDFGSHSVLLDFTGGNDDPSIAFLGNLLAAQCDIATPIDKISQVGGRTLLSRLTAHYMQIIANAAPIGFEAEFTNQRGDEIAYRGIMMPFSSDDENIDFVYGVINWKELAADSVTSQIVAEVAADTERHGPTPVIATGPVWTGDSLTADDEEEEEEDALELSLEDRVEDIAADATFEASLEDCLAGAREAAAAATACEARTHHALYRAIGLAHAFALAARSRPDDYNALLAESGVVEQPRSPMTALAKLIFGATYDKTRIAEFVCAIDYALEQDMPAGALTQHLHQLPGGLKALVGSARAVRRGEHVAPASPTPALVKARRLLAKAGPCATDSVAIEEGGLAVVVMRREADGTLTPVAALDAGDKLAERVFTTAARTL